MSCGKLVFTWVLVGIGVFLMTRFQQAGVLVAIIPMGIAQSIRLEHDRSYFRYFRENKTWQVATAFYYLMLLVISVVAVMGGVPVYYTQITSLFPRYALSTA
jgi:hypothetical protein